jgi:hypothetical protein
MKLFDIFNKYVFPWQPLTIRGILALTLSILALWTIAFTQSDLVANIIGFSVLCLLAISTLAALIQRVYLARRISAETYFDTKHPFSRTEIESGIIIRECSILPFYSLEVRKVFKEDGVKSKRHLVRGIASEGKPLRYLLDSVWMPHRGLWNLEALEFTLGDTLGFNRLSWLLPMDKCIEVSAKNIPIHPLPIVSASVSAGDTLNQLQERSGDLFDIKQYDPSDGVKRILWKTYAKSGLLVVRRPEPAVIPEGKVAIYLIAERNDDHVAGAFQSYLQELYNNQIIVIFGTDGLHNSNNREHTTVDAQNYFIADPSKIQNAINLTAFSKIAGTGKDFPKYIEALQAKGHHVQRIIIFAPQRNSSWFEFVKMHAASYSLALTIALVPDKLNLFGLEVAQSNNETQMLTEVIMNSGAELLICESAEALR